MTTMMSLFQKMKPMEYLESTVAAFSLISNNEKSAQQGADFDFDLDFSEALTLLEPAHNYELRKLRIPSDKHDNPGEVVAICTNCFCAMRKLKPPANWVWLNTNDDNESNKKPVYAVRVEVSNDLSRNGCRRRKGCRQLHSLLNYSLGAVRLPGAYLRGLV